MNQLLIEIQPLIWTNCFLPLKFIVRYDLESPRAFIFSKTDLYFTVSKAFEKSAKTSRVHSLRYIAFNISSRILTRADRFSGWAVFLGKGVGHYPKPINNLSFPLFSLSNHFGWHKNIGFEMNLYKQNCH